MITNINPTNDQSKQSIQEELNRYLSAVSCGILQYTRDTNRVVYANDTALEILGYTSIEEMQEDNFNGVVHTVHPDDAREINGLVKSLTDDNDKVEYEYRVVLKDGRERVCYGSARLISREGEEPMILRSIIDITERRYQARRSMESVLQAFQLAAGETGNTVFIFDMDKQAVLVTNADATQWGIMQEQWGVPYETARSGIVVNGYEDEYIRIHEEMMNGAESAKGKVALRKANGKIGIYELTFHVLKDEYDRFTRRAAGVYKDITVQTALGEERTVFREALHYNSIMTFVSDLTANRILEALTTAEGKEPTDGIDYGAKATYDQQGETFVRQNQVEFLTPGGEKCFDSAALKKLYNEGIRMGEYEVYLKATDQYVLLRFILSGNPENGHIMSHGFCYDITEAKKEDIKQKSREKEAALVFNVLSEEYLNIYIVNPEDASMEVRKQDGFLLEDEENGSRRRYSYNDSWWKYVDSCVPEEEKEAVYRTGCFERVNEELKSKDEYVFNYKSSYGGLHNLQIRVVRMDDGRFILGARNIDELLAEEARQRELLEGALLAAEQSNRAKTRFLNNMSHDIRTPMNAIIGFTTLASSHIDDKEKVTDYLDKIRMSSKHLLNLINDVLDMSRIEAGKVEIEESEVNLAEMIEDIHNIVQADANAKGLSVSFDTSGLQDEYVWCDRLRFDQALLNCISNAIKFTPEQGKIEIIAAQKPCDAEGCATYEMKIRDTGIGMSPDFVKNIFEPFERERTSTVSGTQGTGLGMAITKNLVDMMGGTIEVQSTQNVGTEITIRLTLRKAETAAAGGTGAVEQGGAPEQTLEGLKILLVEDNELNREIAVDFLSEMGAVLDSAENGAEALEKVRTAAAGTYEIILMDVQMPVMDGYEATRQIRALPDRELAAIPIIAMTANAFEEDRHNAEEAGMNGHIPKPIDIDVVIRTVSEVKNRRS